MTRRETIKYSASALLAGCIPDFFIGTKSKRVDLSDVRRRISAHFESLLQGKTYGDYATGISTPIDLYASCDVAIARHIMGEDIVRTLSAEKRREWTDYINSFQQAEDGSYNERLNHSKLHGNGMTIGALGVIGGKQKYQVRLYDDFSSVDLLAPWLEKIDWAKQWNASHQFWGGIHCFSMSRHCTKDWIAAVFEWLNANLDEKTGWWRKGVPHTDRHQPLGGSVHILPMYEHHNNLFPYPERVIDSVLDLQISNGRWLAHEKNNVHVVHYLELDALYAYRYMSMLAPGYKTNEIAESVNRYADLVSDYWSNPRNIWKNQHPHRILSIVGTFGLLQQLVPERFYDSVKWSDIFSDVKLYDTSSVEA